LTIDPTYGGLLIIKMADTKPPMELERSLSDDAIEYHQNNNPITSMSDGVKAFIGLIISIIADDPKIITLDEPEAFLHPALSFRLGKEIGNTLKNDSSKRLFVATHSANFLMGCLQSGVPINIVRLTYSNKVSTARLLPSEKISKLFKHPLLRSVGTLNGLFYEHVIVTESDSDRAFYQEINERLLQFSPEKGIQNCLFLNAQNKQTIHEIVKPLREMGIPCVGIADIDVIKEGGANWSNFTNCGFLPDVTKQETETSRSRIKTKFDEKAIDFKRNGGINVLDAPDQEACNNLFERLEEYGIFVVRNGELESWLKPLGATGHSPKWLIEIFEKMGEDSNSAEYVKPSNDDVWEFIGRIRTWFTNPNRKGIPD
jgi:energy-coupling factor transporter ATP-binding protein EcfA2